MRGAASQSKATVMAKPEPDETGPASGRPDSRADRTEPTFARILRVGRMTLLYGLFAPLIGVLWTAAFTVVSLYPAGGFSQAIKTFIAIILGWGAYVANEVGWMPALTTGALVGLLPRRWGVLWFVSCAGLIGYLVTVVWEASLSPRQSHEMFSVALLGGVSAGTLALALRFIPRPHPKPSA